MGRRGSVFVSDVHLRMGDEAYLGTFLEFLRGVAAEARDVYIHGDLFDFYVGPRQGGHGFYEPLFKELGRLVAAGVRVGVQRGNRDFLVGRRFEEQGVDLLPDEISLELGGRRVHLSHGDQFCIHDRSYQFWARGVLRAGLVKGFVRNLPVPVAVWLAGRYRRVSARKKRRLENVEAGRLPSILDGVRELLQRDFHEVVICGHIHHLAETPVESEAGTARLLTTGAWEEGPNFVHFDGSDFHLRRFGPRTAAPAGG